MHKTWIGAILLPLILGSAAAQEYPKKGALTVGIHEIDMKAGRLYTIAIDATGFFPLVNARPGRISFRPPDFAKPHLVTSTYVPSNDEKNTVFIVPDTYDLKGKGPFEYTIDVQSFALSKPSLDIKGELTATDLPFKDDVMNTRAHHKSFELKTKAKTTYVIDMRTPDGSKLDDYLYLIDANDKVVKYDDDGGGFPHARIVFEAPKDATYRIITTGLGEALGKFHLTVRTAEK